MIFALSRFIRRKFLTLKPNCLLTRAPIVVLPKSTTLWQRLFGPLPLHDYLHEHGYEVLSTAPNERDYHLIRETEFTTAEDALIHAISLAEKDFLRAQ